MTTVHPSQTKLMGRPPRPRGGVDDHRCAARHRGRRPRPPPTTSESALAVGRKSGAASTGPWHSGVDLPVEVQQHRATGVVVDDALGGRGGVGVEARDLRGRHPQTAVAQVAPGIGVGPQPVGGADHRVGRHVALPGPLVGRAHQLGDGQAPHHERGRHDARGHGPAPVADPPALAHHGDQVTGRRRHRVEAFGERVAQVGAHASSPSSRAAPVVRRRLPRAADAWDLTVPREHPRAAAICSSLRSS